MKRMIFRIIAVLASAIALIILIFFTKGTDELLHIIATMEYHWITVAFICIVMYWVMDSVIIRSLAGALMEKKKGFNSFKVSLIGYFYGAITPYASGAQPAQAFVMIKDGAMPGHAVSILFVRAALYQAVLAAYSLVMAMTCSHFFARVVPHFFIIYFTGFLLNMLGVFIYILSLTRKDLVYKLINLIFGIFARFKFLKKLMGFRARLEQEVESFADSVDIFRNKRSILFKCILFEILHLSFYFLITYFIHLSIEGPEVNLWYILSSQAVIMVGAQIIPTPGSTGGAESLSYIFFSLFFRKESIIPVILIWRIVTYYSSVIVGGLITFFVPEKPLKAQ